MQGIELCRRFYKEIVEPLMHNFSSIGHSAALIGSGSEVLGYDTEMSRDHDWGPRVHLFLHDLDNGLSENIRNLLDQRVPQSFYGFPIEHLMLRSGFVGDELGSAVFTHSEGYNESLLFRSNNALSLDCSN